MNSLRTSQRILIDGRRRAAGRPGHRRLWRRQQHAAAAEDRRVGRPATVGLESAGSLGKLLVDSSGRTLYLFKKDAGGSTCVGACAAAWPPLRVHGRPLAGPGLSAAKLTTTARSDGAPQVRYNGHPLYRYTGDAKPGDTNGQRVTAFGAAWFAVSGAGQVITRPASKSGDGGIY